LKNKPVLIKARLGFSKSCFRFKSRKIYYRNSKVKKKNVDKKTGMIKKGRSICIQ